MNTIKNKKLVSFFSIVGLIMPLVTFAAAPLDVKRIIENVINMVVWPIFFGLSVIMFIYAGVKFLTAAGDSSAINDAKKAVIWAMVGIAIAIIGFSIETIIAKLLA